LTTYTCRLSGATATLSGAEPVATEIGVLGARVPSAAMSNCDTVPEVWLTT
jgi:hypothetical protein